MTKSRFLIVLLTISLMLVSESISMPAASAADYYYTKPIPLDAQGPKYPNRAAKKGLEGWVLASFVVEEDGTTSNIEILDVSKEGYFEKSSIDAIKKWKFEPAKENGIPLKVSQYEYLITYALRKERVATRWFKKQYKDILKLTEQQKWQEASSKIKGIDDSDKGLNNYESARLRLVEGVVFAKLGNRRRALISYSHALMADGEYMEKKSVTTALTGKMVMEVELGLYGDALRTYNRLKKHDKKAAAKNGINKVGLDLIAASEGDAPITTGVTVDYSDKPIRHSLLKRKIGFSDIKGTLSTFSLHCDRRYFVASVNSEDTWTLPESWGDCYLSVKGEAGTTFMIIEH